MTFIRTGQQVALNNVLVALRESVDYYTDSANITDAKKLDETFAAIASARRFFVTRLKYAVRAAGDLPTVPDPDKEMGEMLMQRVNALLTSDSISTIVGQRIEADKKLIQLIAENKITDLDPAHDLLFDEISQHVLHTIEQLSRI